MSDWRVDDASGERYMGSKLRRVGAVVLTYNSARDLPECLAGLLAQQGVDLRIVVVDNASRTDERDAMEACFLELVPEGRVHHPGKETDGAFDDASAIFLRNPVNDGYSAGNNIGTRITSEIGCESTLILNPDVRISNTNYVATLAALLSANEHTALACSALQNPSGDQENPMVEPTLLQELLWPASMIVTGFFPARKPPTTLQVEPFRVEKVSGACFLIRTDFLERIGYFDQSVFLYCEESILMTQVRSLGWHMMMDPGLTAVHVHRSLTKGSPSKRYRIWSDSRRYFHEVYGGHGHLIQTLLSGTRNLMLLLVHFREILKNHQ